MSKRNWKSTALSVPVLLLAGGAYAQAPQAADLMKGLTPVTDTMLRDPPAADWLMWRRTYNGWGYSPLDQINKSNVKNLQPAWTWSLTNGATESTPIVHDGRIVSQPGILNSLSQDVTDTLQGLVFNQTRRVPRFGGTHGTCLALDAAWTGRTEERATPHAPHHERQTPCLGRRGRPTLQSGSGSLV